MSGFTHTDQRYAICVGINQYAPTSGLGTLDYAEQDAQAIYDILKQHGFKQENGCLLLGEEATLEAINTALEDIIIDKAHENDLVVFYFAGHSIPLKVKQVKGQPQSEVFLASSDFDKSKILASLSFRTRHALGMERLRQRFFEGEGSKKRLFIFDSCYSGDFYGPKYRDNVNPVQGYIQHMLDSESTGRIALSSCLPIQKAAEDPALQHGRFTYYVLNALQGKAPEALLSDGSVTVNTLFEYVTRQLPPNQRPVLSGVQHDTFVLAYYPDLVKSTDISLPLQASTVTPIKNDEMRKKYLANMIKRYNSVTLPLGPTEGFSLHAIFQPLSLHNDPLMDDSREEEKRRRHPDGFEGDISDKARMRREKDVEKIIAVHGEDALVKSPQGRIIILGGPGTGKTTTLQYLIACRAKDAMSDPRAAIPIIIPLPRFAHSEKTFQQYLVNIVEDMGIERNYADLLWEAVEAKHAFVALDSLDEVEPRERPRMIELINRLASESGNIWLVGSRFTEYKGGQFKRGQFAEWELLPMNNTLRRDLAEKLFPELRRLLPHSLEHMHTPQEFVYLLENHPHAAAWGKNPLLFSLAAVIFVQTGELPYSRATLYRDVIDAVLSIREPDNMKRDHLFRPLTGLALWLHQTKGRTFTHEDLFVFLEDIQQRPWAEAEQIAKSIITSEIFRCCYPYNI